MRPRIKVGCVVYHSQLRELVLLEEYFYSGGCYGDGHCYKFSNRDHEGTVRARLLRRRPPKTRKYWGYVSLQYHGKKPMH